MKTIKLTIVALILACTFQVANAQVRVGVRLGTPPPPRHRVVVVERRPHYRHYYRSRVYAHRRAYRRRW